MARIKPLIKIRYEFDPTGPGNNPIDEVFNFIFEKAQALANAERLAKEQKVSYTNSKGILNGVNLC